MTGVQQQIVSSAYLLLSVLGEPYNLENLFYYYCNSILITNEIYMFKHKTFVPKYFFEFSSFIYVCDQCVSIEKSPESKDFYNRLRADRSGPYLPYYFYVPHQCTLTMMKTIRMLAVGNWLSEVDYEIWLQMNSHQYLVGHSSEVLQLWDERKSGLSESAVAKPTCESDRIKMRRCQMHGRWFVYVTLPRLAGRRDLKALNTLFPYSGRADKSHTNLDVASLISHAYKMYPNMDTIMTINRALRYLPIGSYNVTVTAFLIHALGNPTWPKIYEMMAKDKACCKGPEDYAAYWKAVSVAIRRTARWPDGASASVDEISHTAYLDLAVGRVLNVSDWEEEYQNRVVIKLPLTDVTTHTSTERTDATNEAYLRWLRPELAKIMVELIANVHELPDWPKFIASRQIWSAGGSAGGQYMLIDGKKTRINKHSYFESLKTKEMLSWIESEPKIVAVASEKFEMGKSRAIYGTKPLDYTIVSHVIAYIEPKLSRIQGIELGLQGFDEVQCILRRMHIVRTPDIQCSMIDYADFNKQHTLEAQAAVFEAVARRYKEAGANKDIVRSAEWCVAAHLNQWCMFPAPDGSVRPAVRVIQGMFSGNRATNFLNTILNVAYYRVARAQVRRMYDLSPVDEYSVHQGDDVWISNKSREWAAAMYNVMLATGFEFQASKQMFSTGSGEFLRVLYTTEGMRGYLARALGTFIINPIQNPPAYSPLMKVTALNKQILVLVRRGLNLKTCGILWHATVAHFLKHQTLEGGGMTIPLAVAHAPYYMNGLDVGPPWTQGECPIALPPLPQPYVHSIDLAAAIPTNMSEDWVRVMSQQLRRNIDAPALVSMLHHANVSDSLRDRDRMMSARTWERAMLKWKETYSRITNFRASRVPLDIPRAAEYVRSNDLDILEYMVGRCPMRKVAWWQATPVETIFRAIAQSPFKDLATARTALKVGSLQAARMAVATCRDHQIRYRAHAELESLASKLGSVVVTRLLEGVHGVGSSYEAVFNPIILSWISRTALNYAAAEACAKGVQTVDAWNLVLRKNQRSMLAFAYHNLKLREASFF